ncbi:hypothetical protein H2203_004242 [Taxawa tesnikishii (nom. ined.)]|nr:hypothetical protein H2203_004242 [Dothideales sp. JES 119]
MLEQLNAARGHLRIELDRELEGPVDTLLTKADCNCKEKTYFAYQKALRLLGAWRPQYGPLTTSVMQHVNALAGFPKVFKELVKDHTLCSRFCRNGYENIVKQACDATLDYFDGLCLDCLDRADPVQDQEDGDEDVKATASAHCRIPHDQPTEHFSSYARKFGRSLRAVDGNRTASHNEPRDKPLFAQLRRLGINDRDMPGV